MEITAIICLMCTIVGCLVGYFGFRRNQNNDIRTETKARYKKAHLKCLFYLIKLKQVRKKISNGRGFEERRKAR